jgi:hypothetical protein
MIKKVAKFDCNRFDSTVNKVDGLEYTYLHIFNPNSTYSNPESWVKNKVKQKIENENINLKDCKIHFLSNCTVPRNKIKEFCDANNVKVIRDYTKAEYLIFSNNTIAKACNYSWFHKLETVKFVDFIMYLKKNNAITSDEFDLCIDHIENAEYKDKVLLDYQLRRRYTEYERLINQKAGYPNSERFFYMEDEKVLDIIKNLENNNFIHQDFILQKLNTSNVITEETYNSIASLLSSNDESNQCIGMEIMANSDYDKSCYYILMLFKRFGSTLYYSKYKNHVNFKALVNYFDIILNHSNFDLDTIIFKMKSKGLFTQKYYDMLSKEYIDDLNKYMERGRFNYIGINTKQPFFLNVEVDPEPVNETVNQEPCLNLETQTS